MSDIGAQSPSNEHIDRLAGILLTYNFHEKELGGSCAVLLWQLHSRLDYVLTVKEMKVMFKACQIYVLLCMS